MRTYPSEADVLGADTDVISAIRLLIGDMVKLQRYYLTSTSSNIDTYIAEDNQTFVEPDKKFWPVNVTVTGTTYSGVTDPLVMNYHYLWFTAETHLRTTGLDLWVDTFYLSDLEIWNVYQAVDFGSLVRNSACVTTQMRILKAAIDLIGPLRTLAIRDIYTDRTITDAETSYELKRGSADPFKDLAAKLQGQLDAMIKACNQNIYSGGYRVE